MTVTVHDFGNEWTEDMILALLREKHVLEEKKKAAMDAVKKHHSRAKSLGILVRDYKQVYKLKFADDPAEEQDRYMRGLRQQRRLAQLAGVKVGHQFNLLDAVDIEKQMDDEDAETRAYELGARAYMDVKDENDDNPHSPSTALGQEWLRGFRDTEERVNRGRKSVEEMEAAMIEPDLKDEEGEDGEGVEASDAEPGEINGTAITPPPDNDDGDNDDVGKTDAAAAKSKPKRGRPKKKADANAEATVH